MTPRKGSVPISSPIDYYGAERLPTIPVLRKKKQTYLLMVGHNRPDGAGRELVYSGMCHSYAGNAEGPSQGLRVLVEAAGIEPASSGTSHTVLHT